MLHVSNDGLCYCLVLKNILYGLKSLFLECVKRRVNERYNKHKSFNLTWGERKKSVAVDKDKIWKIRIYIYDFMRYMIQQEPPWLMVRFQSNCIFKIYRDPMQRKNMNIDKNI